MPVKTTYRFAISYPHTSSMENVKYIVENQDGDKINYGEKELRQCVDDMIGETKSIVKQYRLSYMKGQVFRMTLYSDEHPDISGVDYVTHYRELPQKIYGSNVFSKFDEEIVKKFQRF